MDRDFEPARVRAKTSLLVGGAILLVGLATIASVWAFKQVEKAGVARLRTYAVLSSANDLRLALIDAETGQRGFTLTGDVVFLEPYLGIRDRVDLILEELGRLLRDTSGGEQRLRVLTLLVEGKLTHLARLIELRRGQGMAASVALIEAGEGRRLMDSIRAGIQSLVEFETSTLARQEETFRSTMGTLLVLIGLASVLALLLALAFASLLHRESQHRLKTLVHIETQHLLEAQGETNVRLQEANLTIRASEDKLAVTLNSIGDAVIATDAEARVTLVNRVAARLTGWTQAEASGLPVAEIFHIVNKESRQPGAIPVMAALTHGTVQGLANHTVLIARNGTECDVADSCAPIRDAAGQVVGTVLVFRDVTEEYAAQAAVRDSAALVETILKTVGDGLMTIHARGGIIEKVNPAAEWMFGYTADELIGRHFSLLIPELDRDQRNGSLEYYSASVEARAAGLGREVTGHRKDGSSFPLEIALREMTLGGRRYFTGVLRDLTARKAVEAEQNRLNQRLRDQQFYTRSLIESNIDAIMTTDPAGIISDVNKQMEILTGCSRDELIGSPFKNYFTDAERAEAGIKRALAEQKVTDYELTARARHAQETVVSYNATTFFDRDRKLQGVFATARDVTERKRLDLALREKSIELESAKLAAERANLAKSDFLSSMSHELRTPLSAILGFAQLMESGSPPPTVAQTRSIDQILKAGWYLLELINEILDLALIESGKLSLSLEAISLPEVMQECRAMTDPQARKRGIHILFPSTEVPIFVKVDRTRVKQILLNLLSNATKYNRGDGTVTVTYLALGNGRLRIRVEDTGEGLTPDQLTQLFQPFNRLGKESGPEEGTGIGLVVCKRLVEAMGGTIGVESTIGKGSVFWIELNVTTKPRREDRSVPVVMTHQAGGPLRTLLYVEDNPANLMLVEDLIERRPDMRLLSAGDGYRGIEMAVEARPDVILMDINLPGMSGLEALRILADDPVTRHIPVIALSANALPRDIEKGIEAGFFRYLTKPIKVTAFMGTLDEALSLATTRSAAAERENV